MNDFDPHLHGFDKEQPTSTPFRFQHTRKKKPAVFQQVKRTLTQSPLLLVLAAVGGLGLIGWSLAPSWTTIHSSLLSAAQSRSPASPTNKQVAVVEMTPTPMPAKITTPILAPSATPAATPQPTPSITSTPGETKRANVTAPALEETGRFTLQVGAYQNQAEAESKMASLKELGYEARIMRVTLPGKGEWHRVQVGRFATRDAASRLGQQLQTQKAITSFSITAN